MENKNYVKSILQFAEEKGFYIILGLCVVAIGVSGYVLFFTGDGGLAQGEQIALEDPVTNPVPTAPVMPTTVPVQTPTEPPVEVDIPEPPIDVPVVSPTEIPIDSAEVSTTVSSAIGVSVPAYVAPVEGDVIKAFSSGDLVYDETMGDWRTHRGTDFACEAGTEVVAIADGTVSGVFVDPLMGNCVTIAHQNKLVSMYCGLEANTVLVVDKKIKAGQPVGALGTSLIAESAQPSHLHLEVTRDGTHIDPMSLIK